MFYKVARVVVRFLSHLFFPVKVYGDTSVMPEDSGVVLCANHISYADAIYLGIIFDRQIHFVGKDKYAENLFLKPFFKWLGSFGIDPERPDITAIKKCIDVPKTGGVLGIFPEGTRIRDGKISNPMPGVIMIAHKSRAPIFYVRIKPDRGVFRLFIKTSIYIGDTVTVQELGVTNGRGEEYKQAADALLDRIYGLGEK